MKVVANVCVSVCVFCYSASRMASYVFTNSLCECEGRSAMLDLPVQSTNSRVPSGVTLGVILGGEDRHTPILLLPLHIAASLSCTSAAAQIHSRFHINI